MDPDQRKKAFIHFWGKLFLSLITVAILYLSLIRPVQSFLLKHYLLPVLETFLDSAGDLMLVHRTDEIEMIFKSAKFPDMKIELPFTGYFWLSMSMIWVVKQRMFGRIVHIWNLCLLIIIPLLSLVIISGTHWLSPLFLVHQKLYKALFLILGMLAIREGALKLDKHASKKL
ncbi:MAG: hypothetical protein QF835_09940 [Candidatus Marinimicrobia bacterium]|nr:hypothetical protein [Candidatus Neomarinimicrobiota bacterium]